MKQLKNESKEKENKFLRGASTAIVLIGFVKKFFPSGEPQTRWFGLLFAITVVVALAATLYELRKKLRSYREEEIEPLLEASQTPRSQRIKQIAGSLTSAVCLTLVSVYFFCDFFGYSLMELANLITGNG
ncbi:hypothetical protein [Clostridium minihomine]|uniref:hypothetical protein n=1 Tax=Clostridium minihomine TaxID=2045012 RepID=UPI000C772C97|nr:hypothetical protein [Clostridium minihomine]